MTEMPLNKTMHYIYSWTDNGETFTKHFYAPSLVAADKQFKETIGWDPGQKSPAVKVHRITN